MYDIIGDIHGYAKQLEKLLDKLAYKKKNGTYVHPDRKVLFLGDYIDRGPQIRETLQIVRNMVDAGNAIALMGNHEYNAILFNLYKAQGGYMREHSIKNIIQHYETLKQFKFKDKEYADYVQWFKSLPLFYETENLRSVHACWDKNHVNILKSKLNNNRLTDDIIYKYVHKSTNVNQALEELLKGKEIDLPSGMTFTDKDGTVRTEMRIKWWENPARSTYKSISVLPIQTLPERPIKPDLLKNYYNEDEKPVFFGHYWMKGKPDIIRANVCCLDFSVAKGGYLTAYRMDDEKFLDSNKLVYV